MVCMYAGEKRKEEKKKNKKKEAKNMKKRRKKEGRLYTSTCPDPAADTIPTKRKRRSTERRLASIPTAQMVANWQ